MICGDDGRWSSQRNDCDLHLQNESYILSYHLNYADFMYEGCNDTQRLRDLYLNHMLKHPDISLFSRLYPGYEASSSVRMYCNP
ncbi:hypothetical protein DPMN_095232 [Dreissena polymorpha]|uniref:Uncharacterized protein n=1 Tax=Dreissena polymorpha TaxID=45954 RepID=A0A9D4R3D0_DREPO|nr:hypothetical protein DPMN_095232 [Dreissena polymorpha]